MPRSIGNILEKNFAKGLITEASGLAWPEGACTATSNCVHKHTGEVQRRLGYDFEINWSVKSISKTEVVINSYLWKDVSGDGNISLLVMQVGSTLYFYDGSTADPLSSHPITDTVGLTTFSPAGAPAPNTQECQFASGNGKLFVVHPYLEAFSVEYDSNTQTFTATQIDIEIRDFEGIEDIHGLTTRTTASLAGVGTAHRYNMLNQGWTATNLTTWDTGRTDLPSNSDVMWRFKNSSDAFDLATIVNVDTGGGNSPAPKGHYILNVYDQDRGAVSGLSITAVTTGYQRASTVAFFAGRLFYAGTNYVGFNSKIFFSQIIERDEQFGQCYQTNDPSAENLFDLLPTDGGVIVIQDAGTILKMISIPGGLVVFASNGVWLITGSTGIGFTANDYTQSKISSISALTHTSFVDFAGTPVWWNLEGIYRLKASQGGSFEVESMTEQTIKTFYNDIPPSEKRNARGMYNPVGGSIQWLYRSTEAGSLEDYYIYDRILNLDTRTGGFYEWTIPDTDLEIHGIVVLENRGGAVALEDVTDNSVVTVTANDASNVQVWTIGDSIVIPNYKYIVTYDSTGDKFTFAEARDTAYGDWDSYGTAENYESSFITIPITVSSIPSFCEGEL